jgi:citrate synthase
MSTPAQPVSAASGDGLIASSVCHLDAEAGRLTYRGYDVAELAESAAFEETAFLLVTGGWPSRQETSAFRRAWAQAQKLPPASRKWLRGVPSEADGLAVVRTAVSALTLEGPAPESGGAVPAEAMRLMARIAAIAAEFLRLQRADDLKPAWGRQGVATGFLRVATGREPTAEAARAFDAALTLRADNELNPGTFAARVAASTGSDLVACVTAGLGALAGPKHSGHTLAVARLLDEAGRRGNVRAGIAEILQDTKKPAGFGHPVYKVEDPRTRVARQLARLASRDEASQARFSLAEEVEAEVHRATGLYANVDYYLTVIYLAAGLPRAAFAPVFAVSRCAGWIAHVLEQQRDPELIRPRARYEGPHSQHLPARRRARPIDQTTT